MGVTGAQTSVDPQKLEAVVKETLDVTAPRTMVVLAPLKVSILNYPFDGPTTIEVPDFPKDPQRGMHKVVLDRVVYIDRSDFREVTSCEYVDCIHDKQLKFLTLCLGGRKGLPPSHQRTISWPSIRWPYH